VKWNIEKSVFWYAIIDGSTRWKTKVSNNAAFGFLFVHSLQGGVCSLEGIGRV